MSEIVSALKSNGMKPTGVDAEKKEEYSTIHGKSSTVSPLQRGWSVSVRSHSEKY